MPFDDDALALLPLLLELAFPQHGLLPLTRLVRFLKLARYSPALAAIGRLIASERRALLACVIIFVGVSLALPLQCTPLRAQYSRTGLRYAKSDLVGGRHARQNWRGRNHALTTLGSIIAAITVMLGIGCFALPVAIIGRGFYGRFVAATSL